MPPAAPKTETLACLGAVTLKFLLPTLRKLRAALLTILAIATGGKVDVRRGAVLRAAPKIGTLTG